MAVGNVEWGHFGRQEKTQRAAAERENHAWRGHREFRPRAAFGSNWELRSTSCQGTRGFLRRSQINRLCVSEWEGSRKRAKGWLVECVRSFTHSVHADGSGDGSQGPHVPYWGHRDPCAILGPSGPGWLTGGAKVREIQGLVNGGMASGWRWSQ